MTITSGLPVCCQVWFQSVTAVSEYVQTSDLQRPDAMNILCTGCLANNFQFVHFFVR